MSKTQSRETRTRYRTRASKPCTRAKAQPPTVGAFAPAYPEQGKWTYDD